MKKICLIFGGILAIAGNAYAVTSTVTSKDYVDTEVGKKQNTIPVSGTNASTPGTTVVTYTNTAGTIGERGICNDPDEDDCNVGDLVTFGHFMGFAAEVDNAVNNMPTITTSKMTCVDSPDCTLWSVADQTVYWACKAYGESASDASECCSGAFNGGSTNCGCSSDEDCIDPDYPICVVSTHYCRMDGSK